jgi:hypothetical protein
MIVSAGTLATCVPVATFNTLVSILSALKIWDRLRVVASTGC